MAAITVGNVISRAGINTAISELDRAAPDIGGTVEQDWLDLITVHALSGNVRWTQVANDLYVAQSDTKKIAKIAGSDGSITEWLDSATAWASSPWSSGNGVWFMRGDTQNRLCVLFIRQNGTTIQYWARRFDIDGNILEDITWDAGDVADFVFPYTAAISWDGQYVYDVVLDKSDSITIRIRQFDLDNSAAETEIANELTYIQTGPDPADYGPGAGSTGVNAISGTISLGVHEDGSVVLAYAVATTTTSGASAPYTGVGSDKHYIKLYSPLSGSVEFASHTTSPTVPPINPHIGFTDQVSDFIATDRFANGNYGWVFYFDQTALDRFLFEIDLTGPTITQHEQSATPNAGWPLWIYQQVGFQGLQRMLPDTSVMWFKDGGF